LIRVLLNIQKRVAANHCEGNQKNSSDSHAEEAESTRGNHLHRVGYLGQTRWKAVGEPFPDTQKAWECRLPTRQLEGECQFGGQASVLRIVRQAIVPLLCVAGASDFRVVSGVVSERQQIRGGDPEGELLEYIGRGLS